MILCDSRIGSKSMLTNIRNLGCEAELGNELSTDFQWTGHGPNGPVLVGVERKAINMDLLDSMKSRRLDGSQIGIAIDCYDYYYLIVEGAFRADDGGMLEIGWPFHAPTGNFKYSQIVNFLNSLAIIGGVHILYTRGEDDTANMLVSLYGWWNKQWKEHETGRRVYVPKIQTQRDGNRVSLFPKKATPVQTWLFGLPGIGDKKIAEIAPNFRVPADIVTEYDWERFDGIGKVGAKQIVEWIHGS